MGEQICAGLHSVRLSNCLHNSTLTIMLDYKVKLCDTTYMPDKLHVFIVNIASSSYLNILVINVYAMAVSPSVSHMQWKILRHREQK